jgi:Na+/pantothenate symporter
MTRYFIAANIWLVFAVVAILGWTNRNEPLAAMSSFFNGPAMATYGYTFIVLAMLAVSVFFFGLTWKTRDKS